MIYAVFFIILVIGYLLGSLNSSLIVGKFYGVDVRQHGSGNAGATNTLRTLGKKAALLTFIGDFLKGILACLAGYYILSLFYPDYDNLSLGLMLAGLGCVLGHNWPLYFGFRGGKGVLTSFAVLLMMGPLPALIALAVFIIVVLITRIVSISSITAAALLPVIGAVFGTQLNISDVKGFVIFTSLVAALIIFRHSSNIKRLLQGKESKISLSKKGKDELG